MRIDETKINRNLLGEITLPDCTFFRREAENIATMLLEIPPFDYGSTAEFQKRVIIEYWRHYDGLDRALVQYPQFSRHNVFSSWFIKEATAPENIRRACQWLCEPKNGIIELKPAVREKSMERAGEIRAGGNR